MTAIQRHYLFFIAMLACLLCLVSLPISGCSRNLQSATPTPLPGNIPDGVSQQNDIEAFFARFNGCSWYRRPNYPFRDVYFELKDRTLILYEYIKDQQYCSITFSICFAQLELWRTNVTGYDAILTDRRGNTYRVVINGNGETIAMHGMDKAGGREFVTDTFVKYFCSGKN